MKMEKGDTDVKNEFDWKINMMAIFFEIAVSGGTCIRADPDSQTVNAAALLD
jgi:hypothetical protein